MTKPNYKVTLSISCEGNIDLLTLPSVEADMKRLARQLPTTDYLVRVLIELSAIAEGKTGTNDWQKACAERGRALVKQLELSDA